MSTKVSKKYLNNKRLPPKPYTDYTIFFRLEQSRIIQSSTGVIDDDILASLDPEHHDELDFPRPSKYADTVLRPYWYSSAHKASVDKKRKHRKRKGRMDLKTLSKAVSSAWKTADPEVIEYCKKLAKAETEKYQEIVQAMNRQEKASEATREKDAANKRKFDQAHAPTSLFRNTSSSSSNSTNTVSTDNSVASNSNTSSDKVLNGEDIFNPPKQIKTTHNRRVTVDSVHSIRSKNLISSQEVQALKDAFSNDMDGIIDTQKKYESSPPSFTFKPSRRASMTTMAPEQESLRSSFQEEVLDNNSYGSSFHFHHVPSWEKKDVDALLNVLNAPQDDTHDLNVWDVNPDPVTIRW